MLTFVRQGEMRQAKWSDFNLKAKEWNLPAETTKMKDDHIVPLARQTLAVLEELHEITGNNLHGLLLPSQNRQKNPIMCENTINNVLKKMGYKGQMVGHGFRALASTTLNEQGFRPDVIERQLAHRERNAVRAAYNRAQYMEERRAMMQHWADFLDKCRATKPKGEEKAA
jgi:integrase